MKKRYIHLLFIVEIVLTGVLVIALLHKEADRIDRSEVQTSQSATLGESTYNPSGEVPDVQISLAPPQQTTTATSGKGVLGLIIQLVSNTVQSFSGEK